MLKYFYNIPEQFQKIYKSLPPGRIDAHRANCIYNAALDYEGPFLEIGSFVGRASACISAGIRDSGKVKKFCSIDNHEIYRNRDFLTKITGENCINCSDEFLIKLDRAGSYQCLRDNLADRGLLEFVDLINGDYDRIPDQKYGVVYVDGYRESVFSRNIVPVLKKLVHKGSVIILTGISTYSDFKNLSDDLRFTSSIWYEDMLSVII